MRGPILKLVELRQFRVVGPIFLYPEPSESCRVNPHVVAHDCVRSEEAHVAFACFRTAVDESGGDCSIIRAFVRVFLNSEEQGCDVSALLLRNRLDVPEVDEA